MDHHPNPVHVFVYMDMEPGRKSGSPVNRLTGVGYSIRRAHGKVPHAVAICSDRSTVREVAEGMIMADVNSIVGAARVSVTFQQVR